MIEVEMSKDIRTFETKFLGPFTFRQTIAIAISAVYGIPFMIFFKPLAIDDRILVGILLMVPVIACGWLKIDGMHFETYIIRYIYWGFLTPKKRKYKTENSYLIELDKIAKQEKEKELSELTTQERKTYLKNVNKKKAIVYSEDPTFKVFS